MNSSLELSFLPYSTGLAYRDSPDWCLDPLIGWLYNLFGEDTWLVPVDRKRSEASDLSMTREPDCQKALAKHNVVVVCGEKSQNLSVVIVQSEEKLAGFLELNPSLGRTLITGHQSSFFIWFRAKDVPGRIKLNSCELIGEGEVAILAKGDKTSGVWRAVRPAAIDLGDLKWLPEDLAILIDRWRTRQFGPQFVRGKPNLEHFASFLVEQLVLSWDPVSRMFLARLREKPEFYTVDQIKGLVSQYLAVLSERASQPRLLQLLVPATMNALIRTMKKQAPVCSKSLESSLQKFVSTHFVAQKGGTATNSEIVGAFCEHYQESHGVSVSPFLVQRLVRSTILNVFGIRCSKSIERPGGCQNGFRGLMRRDQPQSQTEPRLASASTESQQREDLCQNSTSKPELEPVTSN